MDIDSVVIWDEEISSLVVIWDEEISYLVVPGSNLTRRSYSQLRWPLQQVPSQT